MPSASRAAVAALSLPLFLSACAADDNAAAGGMIGGTTGAVVGSAIGGGAGAAAGAALGAAGGAGLGSTVERRPTHGADRVVAVLGPPVWPYSPYAYGPLVPPPMVTGWSGGYGYEAQQTARNPLLAAPWSVGTVAPSAPQSGTARLPGVFAEPPWQRPAADAGCTVRLVGGAGAQPHISRACPDD